MKKYFHLVFFSLFSFCAHAQEKSARFSADLDLGFCFLKVEHPNLPLNQLAYPSDTLFERTWVGTFGSFGIYGRAVYISPNWSLGLFTKPGFGSTLHRGVTGNNHSMLMLQLPLCLATEIGKTNDSSPGIIAGGGISFNYYEISNYRISPFYKAAPYFFVQAHLGHLGVRFAETPNQTFLNKNGTTTKTHMNFTLTILATLPLSNYKQIRSSQHDIQ